MHKLLARLIRRYLPDGFSIDSIEPFIGAVSRALVQQDEDRQMLERSLMLTSDELNEKNKKLRRQLSENLDYQQKIEESLVRQRTLLDASPEAVFSYKNDGSLNQANINACEMLGHSKGYLKRLGSRNTLRLCVHHIANKRKFLKVIRNIQADNHLEVHDFLETTDGRHLEYYSVPELLEGQCLGRVWCVRDITDFKKNQELLQHQAFHDPLTGLPNRAFLIQSLWHAIRMAERKSTIVAILFVDLDNFKRINDTVGHSKGDQCLIEASQRISSVLRESDILARLGGDEFVLALEDTKDQNEIIKTHDRILRLFESPFHIDDSQYVLTGSIGVSLFPQDGTDPEDLIRKADMSMYQAKNLGKNTFHYFNVELEQNAIKRMSVEAKLRDAIEKEQFVLHYQPKICLKTDAMVGVEALIRWQIPGGELIYPDAFIQVAEDTGLIRQITNWLLETACRKLNEWRSTALNGISISINVSAIELSDQGFLEQVSRTLKRYKTAPNMLELELTESLFFNDIQTIRSILSGLKSHGVMLSIDDFGTGYSSFSYLQDLDIDSLKIDKCFVQGAYKNERSLAIVKSIIDIGNNLGLSVIAEGVETEGELLSLKSARCDIGQGYYISRPIPEDQLMVYAEFNRSERSVV